VRDLVWTIIAIWLAWKIFDMFKNVSKPKITNQQNTKKEGEVRIDKTVNLKSHFNANDAEYVDYEEVK